MLKTVFRDWLGIIKQDRNIEKIERKLEDLDQKIEAQKDMRKEELGQVEETVEDMKQMLYESRPATADLSKKERQVLELFLQENTWKDKEDIADQIDISKNYAGTLLTRLKEKMNVESKQVDQRGRKAYKLAEEEKQRIEQGF
jgi:DNA-binding CsgD family transcriptional regulator